MDEHFYSIDDQYNIEYLSDSSVVEQMVVVFPITRMSKLLERYSILLALKQKGNHIAYSQLLYLKHKGNQKEINLKALLLE